MPEKQSEMPTFMSNMRNNVTTGTKICLSVINNSSHQCSTNDTLLQGRIRISIQQPKILQELLAF